MTENSNTKHLLFDCNVDLPNFASRINWRASLVPAAAVIPAPIAYIKVVAVKKLVVVRVGNLKNLHWSSDFLKAVSIGFVLL